MIPAEAVEAAERELLLREGSLSAKEIAHIALEAAAPHMLTGAWDEGYDRAESDHYGTGFWTTRLRGNPYRPTDV